MTEKQAGDMECVIGIDIGGTGIKAAAVNRDGEIMIRKEVITPAGNLEALLSAIKDLVSSEIERCREEGMTVRAVGIVAAGFIDYRKGIIMEAPNVAWKNIALRGIVEEHIGLPVALDNDANGAAAGERFAGIARGIDDLVYLTLGTGVGGGVFSDGTMIRGHRGMGAELGHISKDPNGEVCGCGRRGCLETMANGISLGRRGAALARKTGDSIMIEMAHGDPDNITGKITAAAARQDDPLAREALDEWSIDLAEGIIDYINVFDPEMVVIGGGVSQSGDLFMDRVRELVAQRGNATITTGVRLELSTLGNDAGIIGAAGMAWEEYNRRR